MKHYALVVAAFAVLVSGCGKKDSPADPQTKPTEDLRLQYVGNWARFSVSGSPEDEIEISPTFKVYRHLSPESYDSVMMGINLKKVEKNKILHGQMSALFKNLKKGWTRQIAELSVEGDEVSVQAGRVTVKYGPVFQDDRDGSVTCFDAVSSDSDTKQNVKSRFCKYSDEDYADVLMEVVFARQAQLKQLLAAGHEAAELADWAAQNAVRSVSKVVADFFMNRSNAVNDAPIYGPQFLVPDPGGVAVPGHHPGGPIVTRVSQKEIIELISIHGEKSSQFIPNGSSEGALIRVVTGPNTISECVVPLPRD